MYSKFAILCICFFSWIILSSSYAADKNKIPDNELQVLIDVSGSMKKNDPINLRIPAIKLLINLLPEGSQVGIWLFAENTHELVKTGRVDKQWKKNALSKIKKIHSRGLFTNIEKAIESAIPQWDNRSEKQNRHLILLTDGMVDISKDIMQSAESRARIMSEQIPLLQQAGVKVQAIALSAEADIELLEKLAFDTGGWSEVVLSADQLQKMFFKLFKQAVPQDTVPLTGNVFSIDAAIKEFSVLVFKQTGASETQLITPALNKITSSSTLRKVSWLNEKNYDLVTIKDPKAGEWKIVAAMDPDNQVMIVTDLKFQIDELPKHITLNESFEMSGFFTDQQQLISREDFLSLIEISVQQVGGKKWMMQPVKDKQGLFSKQVEQVLTKGKHTLKIVADGKTFKRELEKHIEVVESLVQIKKKINLAERTVTITLTPDRTVINTEMMTVEANISETAKQTTIQAMDKQDDQWKIVIDAPVGRGKKIVNFSIMANSMQGNSISPNISPVIIDEKLFISPKPKEKTLDPVLKEKVEDKKIIPEIEEELVEDIEPDEEKEPVNWIKTTLIVVGVNLLLLIIGFFVFQFMKKQTAVNQEKLLSRLG